LALAGELADTRWDVRPLAAVIANRFRAYLPTLHYPVRTGVHANTAFALSLALDYARNQDRDLAALIEARALAYFGADRDAPAGTRAKVSRTSRPAIMQASTGSRRLP